MSEKFQDPLENPKPFEIPQQFLNQLNEMAPSGFILFYVNQVGEPEVRAFFDHPIAEMGLRSYATKFLKGISQAEEEAIAKTLHPQNDEEELD